MFYFIFKFVASPLFQTHSTAETSCKELPNRLATKNDGKSPQCLVDPHVTSRFDAKLPQTTAQGFHMTKTNV